MNTRLGLMWIFVIHLTNYVSSNLSNWTVEMYQVNAGQRSIGSSTTVISEIEFTGALGTEAPGLTIYFFANPPDTHTLEDCNLNKSNAFTVITLGKLDKPINLSFTVEDYNMTLSYVETTGGRLMEFQWYFPVLTKKCNNLILVTVISYNLGPNKCNHTELNVSECQSPETIKTTNQNSSFIITTKTDGHYLAKGNCSCLGMDEKLFDTNGKEFKGVATCGQDAQWDGYGKLQCWSGPTNASVLQSNRSVGEHANFVCDFTDGFPSVTDKPVIMKNNIEIPSNYILESSDNGEDVSCTVRSNYTDIVSPVIPIIVYYDPEKPQLSDDSPVIEVNGSTDLNFTFSANPRDRNISLSFYSITGNDVPSAVLSWTSNYSRGTSQIHGFIVTVTSTDDYGEYDVCAATFEPVGNACSRLEISNATSTTNTPDTTEILNQSTIGSENPELQPNRIGIIVGAVVGGLVALLVIIAAIYFSRRKRDDVKEERINEIYDTSPNPGPGIEAVYAASGETSQREMTTNVAYEASPHQPEVQDVYTTVKRDKKGNGQTEKPLEDKSSSASTSVEQNAPVVNDVYAVVKK